MIFRHDLGLPGPERRRHRLRAEPSGGPQEMLLRGALGPSQEPAEVVGMLQDNALAERRPPGERQSIGAEDADRLAPGNDACEHARGAVNRVRGDDDVIGDRRRAQLLGLDHRGHWPVDGQDDHDVARGAPAAGKVRDERLRLTVAMLLWLDPSRQLDRRF
jgi:hypothetical protein